MGTVTLQSTSQLLSLAACKVCGCHEVDIIHSGWIRDGLCPDAVAGKVYHCQKCDVGWLEARLRKDVSYYETNEYRVDIPYRTDRDILLIRDRLIPFEREDLRDKVLIDIGAGNGLFAGIAQAFGATTYFIEPNEVQAELLHVQHYEASEYTLADYVTLFDVIEHVDDPLELLEMCRGHMLTTSQLIISTPRTTHPILNPGWFYRTQHTWYFNDKSLEVLCNKAGLFRVRQWVTGTGDKQQLYQKYILR